MLVVSNKNNLAYIIGIAMGDGNLSNPNKRAVRLRITCDIKYPFIIKQIINVLKQVAPENKTSIIKRKGNAIDISCYSNNWEKILGWKANGGSKINQNISVPVWIQNNPNYIKNCLRGLFQTDGSVYKDRGYVTVNFVSCIPQLTTDVLSMIEKIGFEPNIQKIIERKIQKNTIKISKNAEDFIRTIKLKK